MIMLRKKDLEYEWIAFKDKLVSKPILSLLELKVI